ncbi:DUF2189 domain-containing protein [Methylopila sp. M107]|uniref:DUF2189 domain-containing protein n=1 Tax=Methylopila sp. M107 TaxID=1101190 RepID=UPI00036AF43A|nr:DUF2189 domain-containing protein [Methylopila sp. M107]
MTYEPHTIRNPVEWGADNIGDAARSIGAARAALRRPAGDFDDAPITIRPLRMSDLAAALREGFDDFLALRTDVLAIGLIYPLAGLLIAQLALNASLAPMVFPLVAGFALFGPFAALGLYEASRRREAGLPASWTNVVDAFASPSAGAIWALGLILTAIFLTWLATAWLIYMATMGPELPRSISTFMNEVVSTREGQLMTIVGCAVGALFAVLTLCVSAISFPLLLDRKVRLGDAVAASTEAVRENPLVMLTWGIIVAGLLALGSLPLLLGLIVVVPVLGHATWRLYRRVAG